MPSSPHSSRANRRTLDHVTAQPLSVNYFLGGQNWRGSKSMITQFQLSRKEKKKKRKEKIKIKIKIWPSRFDDLKRFIFFSVMYFNFGNLFLAVDWPTGCSAKTRPDTCFIGGCNEILTQPLRLRRHLRTSVCRYPMSRLMVHFAKTSEVQGWSLIADHPRSLRVLHVPSQQR